ncbi:leucine-rich repeat protein soc-2 homolog [Phlebotomus papatasi]|uniref:leucine-rich repeat protein soc-2 homolog n=1 Tax=Phlebotomus papatasi TaxID=29031 RepID=UPI002483801B|nr:leucine-rich repeat protein soc-2 homolog [Phlebotomus papatasi]
MFSEKAFQSVLFLVVIVAQRANSALQIASCENASSNTTHCVFNNLIGSSIIFKSQSSTEMVSVEFKNCNFPKVPITLLSTYPNVMRVDMSKCQMRQLNGKMTLSGAKKLKILDMSENNLDELSDGVFSEGAELVELYLARNQISTVAINAFAGLKKLEILDLSFNTIKTMRGDVFWDLRQIRIIYVNNNAMSTMRISFVNCTNIEEFDGSHNDLSDWSLTYPAKSKVVLNLSYCKLKNTYSSAADKGDLIIDGNAVDYIKIYGQVTRVSAKYNKLRFAEIDPKLPITTLEFAGNYITDIANITKIKTVEKLDLSENRLLPLTSETFSLMQELRVLNLRSTGISLNGELLTNQKKLIHLDISANDLTSLNLRDLKTLTSLKTLFLHENKLTELKHLEDIKEILPSLTTISLSKNRFTCSYIQRILTLLENLRINVLLDTKNLANLNTNVLGIDCYATDDVVANNSSALQRMLIFRESALDLENRFKVLFKNIDAQLSANVNNLIDILQPALQNPKPQSENLKNLITEFGEVQRAKADELQQKLAEIANTSVEFAKFRDKFNSLQLDEKLSVLLSDVNTAKRVNEENVEELTAKLTADQNTFSYATLIGNISAQLRNISSPGQSQSIDQLRSEFSSWKYIFISSFLLVVLVGVFFGAKLYIKRKASLFVSRENLTSSEMI